MLFMTKIFGGKTATVTSTMIRARITEAETEIAALRAKIGGALAGVAALSDSEHLQIESEIAATERAIIRLESLVTYLRDELPKAIATEAAAEKAAADEALRQRAEAAREANTKAAAKLLKDYDKLAAQIGDIFSRLKEISDETTAVNAALRTTPLAATVASYHDIHRKSPDQAASETRTMRPHWIYRDAPARADELVASIEEDAILATFDANGNSIRPAGVRRGRFGQIITPQLENREVVTRTQYRPGRSEESLDAVHLPPGFAGGASHWPRK
jgi:hypothetical protein